LSSAANASAINRRLADPASRSLGALTLPRGSLPSSAPASKERRRRTPATRIPPERRRTHEDAATRLLKRAAARRPAVNSLFIREPSSSRYARHFGRFERRPAAVGADLGPSGSAMPTNERSPAPVVAHARVFTSVFSESWNSAADGGGELRFRGAVYIFRTAGRQQAAKRPKNRSPEPTAVA
jgi:hypothetical protein